MKMGARFRVMGLAVATAVVFGCQGAVLDESLTDLNIGECVRDTPDEEVEELERVDCTDAVAVRVVERFDIEGYSDFPGDETVDEIAIEQCPPEALVWLVPTEETWEQLDDRLVICFE